jgi:hypothetical protein
MNSTQPTVSYQRLPDRVQQLHRVAGHTHLRRETWRHPARYRRRP